MGNESSGAEDKKKDQKSSGATTAPPDLHDYYSDPGGMFSPDEMLSPAGSRPGTPIMSDTEYETKQRGKMDTPPGMNKEQR